MDNTLVRTDVQGNQVYEHRHWSFSTIDKFQKCARKYFYYDVAKLISEPENPQMREGFVVHKSMADYISRGVALPSNLERHADWVTTMITGQPGEIVLTEHKLACTYQWKPCEYFSRIDRVWARAQADLLVINGPEALSVDWKTGKEPDDRYETLPKNFQLRVCAFLVFLHFPQVRNVKSKYVYLNEGTSTTFDMPKTDLREFIPQMMEIYAGYDRAHRMNEFPPHPSGLCKKHCAVTQCQFHGIGRV